MNSKKRGFTLIELLVVVVIIAILAAVALPQYQKAVAKSRISTAMSVAKIVANAQEIHFMNEGSYATVQENLDIAVPAEAAETEVSISTEDDYKFVIAAHKNLPNVHYIVYQQHSKYFPNNIHCEAQKDDTIANWVCETGLGGEKVESGSITPTFITYILQGSEQDGRFNVAKAYYNQQNLNLTGKDSCEATEGQGCKRGTFRGESSCSSGMWGGCSGGTFYDDATCVSEWNPGGDSNTTSYGCGGGTFYDNSTCLGKYNSSCVSDFYGNSTCIGEGFSACTMSLQNSHGFHDNSKCISKSGEGCMSNFHDNSTCETDGGSCRGYFMDNATVISSQKYGCRTCYFSGNSSCVTDAEWGCGGNFSEDSSCESSASGGCRDGIFSGNSYCVANAKDACPGGNDWRYKDNSYCVGPYCDVGTRKPDGTLRTKIGEE